MSFAKVYSAQTHLLRAHIITIEADLSHGIYSFSVVGLPDKAIKESKDRVGAAIKNSGYKSPKSKNQKAVISLAPADLKKEGPLFDLGMTLSYLLASGEIAFDPEKKIFLGELSLDGKLRKINGVLPLVKKAKDEGFEEVYVPEENRKEASLVEGISVFAAETLSRIIEHLDKSRENHAPLLASEKTEVHLEENMPESDFSDVRGQESAKRGLEIAAAGGHNIAMWGPPGTGKTMLARAFAGILPPLSFEEMLEVTGIYSIAGLLKGPLVTRPPVRPPHHTSSYVSLVGGGAIPKPGEITLAHRGVLFLDEFPEFEKRVIEAMRQPLEERVVSVSRVKMSAEFPANFILIAALNPCPCGMAGVKGKECSCSALDLKRYERKLSGPILDRIDLWVEVGPVDHRALSDKENQGEKSREKRNRVIKAREIQKERFRKANLLIGTNSELPAKDVFELTHLKRESKDVLNQGAKAHDLSARGYHRVVKLARTIADLEGSAEVEEQHILEAFQYRPKRKQGF